MTDPASWLDNGDTGPNDAANGDTPHVAMAKGEGAGLASHASLGMLKFTSGGGGGQEVVGISNASGGGGGQ